MGKITVVALLVVAFAVLGAACGNEKTRTATPETVVGSAPADTGPVDTGATDGGAVEGDPAAGAEVFAAAGCGSCHALADAGASGAVGPDLDASQPDYALVVDRVTNGAGAMPAFSGQLSEDDIKNVAAYVVQATSG
jgi:sulfite dehydrogenase